MSGLLPLARKRLHCIAAWFAHSSTFLQRSNCASPFRFIGLLQKAKVQAAQTALRESEVELEALRAEKEVRTKETN